MIEAEKPNPFYVLKLPTNATQAEMVSQTENLALSGAGEERLIHWAAEQLRTNLRTRLEYELFELPGTCYADEGWETFVSQYRPRRREAALPAQVQEMSTPGLNALNLAALAELFLENVLVPCEPDLEQAINGSPLVPRYTLPLKEEDGICG